MSEQTAAENFDSSGLPIGGDCPARHPDTGNHCLEPLGHVGLHSAMGVQRIQSFGESAARPPRADPHTPAAVVAAGDERGLGDG